MASKVPVSCNKEKRGRVGEIERHGPLEEAETTCRDFRSRVKAMERRDAGNGDEPRNRPPVCGVLVAMRQKREQRFCDQSEENGDGGAERHIDASRF